MQLQYNRRLASAVLAVCILASVFGLGGACLARTRNAALRVFEEGVDTSFAVRFSIDAYLENCADYAQIMAEEFRLRADPDSEIADLTLELAGQTGDSANQALRKQAYDELRDAVESLYTLFHSAVSRASDQSDFDRAYANFQGEVNKISYDEYNSMSRSFNALRENIPARWIAKLLGLSALETFD